MGLRTELLVYPRVMRLRPLASPEWACPQTLGNPGASRTGAIVLPVYNLTPRRCSAPFSPTFCWCSDAPSLQLVPFVLKASSKSLRPRRTFSHPLHIQSPTHTTILSAQFKFGTFAQHWPNFSRTLISLPKSL